MQSSMTAACQETEPVTSSRLLLCLPYRGEPLLSIQNDGFAANLQHHWVKLNLVSLKKLLRVVVVAPVQILFLISFQKRPLRCDLEGCHGSILNDCHRFYMRHGSGRKPGHRQHSRPRAGPE